MGCQLSVASRQLKRVSVADTANRTAKLKTANRQHLPLQGKLEGFFGEKIVLRTDNYSPDN